MRHEGKHYTYSDLEFWAEDGLVFIEDRLKGDFLVVTRKDFGKRAEAINIEAKRAEYKTDRDKLNDLVLSMHSVWKEAKDQGDPTDINIARKKYKESRKVSLITNLW